MEGSGPVSFLKHLYKSIYASVQNNLLVSKEDFRTYYCQSPKSVILSLEMSIHPNVSALQERKKLWSCFRREYHVPIWGTDIVGS